MRIIKWLLISFLLLSSSLLQAAWQDSNDTEFSYSPRPTFDRVNRLYSSVVTVTNQGEQNISGPMRIMFDASSHQVMNADGEENGLPYILLDIEELAAGASQNLTVKLELKRAGLSLDMRLQSDIVVDGTGLQLAEDQIAIFYNRPDGDYTDWGLHLFNGQGCGNYAVPTTESVHFNNWPDPYPVDGVHPEYGGYFILTIEPGADCYNFIVHKGDEKALGPNDSRFEPANGQEAFTFDGFPELWYEPVSTRPIFLDGARAHWMSPTELLWLTENVNAAVTRLYYSEDAGLSTVNETSLSANQFVELSSGDVSAHIFDENPHLAGFSGFNLDVSAESAKTILKGQIIAVALDQQNTLLEATRVQIPRILDVLYTSAENDADEAQLGLTYFGDQVTQNVWAPTAQMVKLKVYSADKNLISNNEMALDTATGIWSYTSAVQAVDRLFYRYELSVYHPLTQQIETLETTDPYSVGLSTNGRYTQYVDLTDEDLKPEGWDTHTVPTVTDPEDNIIYEGHIRDFSILDESTSAQNRGKYLAFTEQDSAPVTHLRQLQEAGLTHFHVLPANDIASIQEDVTQRVDLTDTVARLCEFNSSAPVCGVEDPGATLLSVLQGYAPETTDAQALIDALRGLDGFNWGYDPHHFAAPEGSYASDPDGVARIVEMRAMNQALHEMGLRVVLDVVYNHTASSGLFDNSVLDKVVPGYYHRLSETTGGIENSTCCENTATEHRMMSKLMSDSLVSFAEHFGFDSFRFDLMGHIPKQAILEARNAVWAVDPDNYFYGEGWNFGEVVNNRRFEQAAQLNMAGSEVGTFSDRQRDAVRSGALFNAGGSLNQQDVIRVGLVGNISSYEFVAASGAYLSAYDYQWNGQPAGYSDDPADTVNYISKHDNETLWDQLQYNLPGEMSPEDRIRAQNVSLSVPLLSQGIPFLHMGSELVRSKSMDRNTFDAGDWFNRVDFTQTESNWNIGLPLAQDNQNNWGAISGIIANPNSQINASGIQLTSQLFKEFLSIRSQSKLFRLTNAADVSNRIKFHNTGQGQIQGLIVMSLDDGNGLPDIDPYNDAIVVVFNGSAAEQSFTINGAVDFTLHENQTSSADSRVQSASFSNGTFNVPALTTAVFVKLQGEEQGFGLSALPPYGDRAIYLRGQMNDWDTSSEFEYVGNDTYQLEIELLAGSYEFKIADEFFSVANIGGGFNMPIGSEATLSNFGNNLVIQPVADGLYRFELNATDASSPTLLVTPDDPSAIPPPYGETTIYLRGLFGDWGTNSPMEYKGDGIYRATYTLGEGETQFKVAAEDWANPNLGSNETMNPGDTVNLTQGSGDNIRLLLGSAEELEFELDANNVNNPSLTVQAADPYANSPLFLRGSFNGWGEGNAFSFVGDRVYTTTLPLDSGDYIFKVATADWGDSYGSDQTLSTEASAQLFGDGGDVSLSLTESGNATFTLDKSLPEEPVISVIVE